MILFVTCKFFYKLHSAEKVDSKAPSMIWFQEHINNSKVLLVEVLELVNPSVAVGDWSRVNNDAVFMFQVRLALDGWDGWGKNIHLG